MLECKGQMLIVQDSMQAAMLMSNQNAKNAKIATAKNSKYYQTQKDYNKPGQTDKQPVYSGKI